MNNETAHKILSAHQSWRRGLVDKIEFTSKEINEALELAIANLQSDPYEPDWSQAPDWANYYGIDADGQRWWYKNEPRELDLDYEERVGQWSKHQDKSFMKLYKRP